VAEVPFTLTPPAALDPSHELIGFSCGEASLDEWLRRRARNSEGKSARTFVVCDGLSVVGYYCLATGAVDRIAAPKALQRNMPDPLPVLVLGRLAVDSRYQGHGIGSALMRDAILRAFGVSRNAGIRALMVNALSDAAKRFYLTNGFIESPIDPMILMLPIALIEQTVASMREDRARGQ